MAQNYNVTIKRYNGTDWDVFYPRTTAENIISGTLDINRIPNIPVSKLTDGGNGQKINASLLPAIALTNVTTYSRWDTFAGLYSNDKTLFQEGDVVIITGDDAKKGTYIHNGGTSGVAEEDFTLMELPNDVVTSINGKKGQVTLTYTDIEGLTSGSYIKSDIIPNLPISKITNLQSNLDNLNNKINDKQRKIQHITVQIIPSDPTGELWKEGDIIFHNYD